MENVTGKTLGRYQIQALLGGGGMGVVYRAYDPNLRRDVAIKVMHPHLQHKQGFKERFLQEAIVAARLKHPGIVQVFDSGEANGVLYIVMAFIPGENLEEMLDELREKGEWVLLSEATEVVQQVSLALDYAHRHGVLHRDIKPGNIMLEPEPCGSLAYRPVLTDLGLAKLLEGGVQTQTGTSMGTPAYMSPEQALGQPVDVRSDVYSLGALLYHLCAGKPPFPAKTITEAIHYHVRELPPPPRTLNPNIPIGLEAVILKALEKDPGKRFTDSGCLGKALGEILPLLSSQAEETNTMVETGGGRSLMTMLQQSMAELRGPSVLDEFPGTAPKAEVDQIQVMEPEKTSHTVIVKGQVTGVGRKGDNQIVLEDPKVSRYHLRIEQVGTAYQVTDLGSANGTFLSGVRLLKGVPQAWAPEQPLQVGDTYLKLVRAREVAGTQVDIGRISVPQKEESRFAVTLDKAQSSVEPGSSDTFSVKIRNQASQVDHYQLSVEGVPGDWVKNLPGQPLRCMPGEEQMVSLVIQPPRAPQSRAGRYPLAVVVTSQEDPSQVMRSTSTLTVTPYRLFSGQLYPERVRAGKSSWVRMANQGNMPETFEITWSDQANELVFEPSQARIKVEEGKSAEMEFRGRLRQRRWMGGEKSHRFSTQVNMLNGQPQMVPGEFISKGLIPPWLLPLVMMLCVLLLAGAGAFYGMVIQPQAQKTQSAGTAIAQAAITASVAAEQNRDVDGDGLSNIREYEYATDSNNPDTDGDGLTDGEEVDRYDTKPKNPDSDGDSWLDGREVKEEGTSPNNRDTDGDNLQDNVDPDPGHLPTSTPIPTHTPTSTPSPIFTITLPPTQSPPDINFTDDDGDGLTYGEEKALGTNPGKADTDGDNLSDYKEVKEYKTDPTDVDTDSDGMNDNNEIERGTNPNKRPRIMYDFVTKANKAVWMSGVGDRLVLNTLVIPWTSVKAGSQLTLSPDPNIAQGIIDFGGPYNNPKGSAMLRNNLELEDGKTYPSFLWTHPRYVDDGYIMGFFTDILNSGYVVGAEDDFVLTVGFQKGAASGNVRFIVLIRTESGMNITLNPIQKSYDEKLRSNRFPLKAWEGQKVDFVLRVEANGPSKQDWSIWLKARIERNE